jgi:iron complex transport system substrate-binding protein
LSLNNISKALIKLVLLVFGFSSIALSCNKIKNKDKIASRNSSLNGIVKYAKGFDIQVFENYKKLIIKSPYPGAKNYREFILFTGNNNFGGRFDNTRTIRVPLHEIVATSTTHIPMLELLHEETSLIGFPNTDYISSPKTRELIAKGSIKEIGNEQSFNTEILISLQPDAVIGFTMGDTSKMYDIIEKNGIPVIFNGEWLEDTPLGRAEWIKFFGVIFDKDKAADSIFRVIETEYIIAKEKAKQAKNSPTILTGVLYKDKWSLPAGGSFMAQLLEDANTNYLWKETKGQGSLVLSFESVFSKAKNVDFWIGSGYFTSLEDLGNANAHYKEFKPFKDKDIYTFSKKRGASGGVLYFELAPVQPHIVLQDLIKVTHPEILSEYKPFFLEKVE